MAANTLQQIPGVVPIKGFSLPSKPKLALSLSFSSAMNLKGQSWQMCAPLTSTLASGRRCTSFFSFAKESSVIAYAQSGSPASESEEEGDTQNEAGSLESTTLAVTDEQPKPPPRKPRIKFGEIMRILNKQAVEAVEKERFTPDIRSGDIIELRMVAKSKRRLARYKGIVISRQNAGIHTTIRIRRVAAGIGTEMVFPIYSPKVKEIKVVEHRKVRRAKLYYLRKKLPRFYTFKF